MKIFKINKVILIWIILILFAFIILVLFSLNWYIDESININLQKENNQLFAYVNTSKAQYLKLNNFYTINYKNYEDINQIVEMNNLNNGTTKLLLREKEFLFKIFDSNLNQANLIINKISFFNYIFKLIK